MKKVLYRIGMMLFILGGTALFYAANHYDLIKVKEVVCKADDTTLALPINEYVSGYMGSSILDFPASNYLDTIFNSYPQIQKASVKCDAGGGITFDYDLKKPVILINLDIVYGLTARGELVPAGNSDMPVITGIKASSYHLYEPLSEDKIGYALKIAELLNGWADGITKKISAINLGSPSGLSLFLEGCGCEIILGRGDEDVKLRKIASMQKFLCSLGDDINSVDLRFSNQLILRKKN
jgi:cell division septal protein FtsQ